MKIDFINFASLNHGFEEEFTKAFQSFVLEGRYINGPSVERFERDFSAVSKHEFNIALSNGLDSLEIALRAIGVSPGDQVIVPSNTYIATWLAVSNVGAEIIAVEPDTSTHLIDIQKIEDAITAKTRVILPVHLYGKRCDISSIRKILRDRKIVIVDDCAQSHGAYPATHEDMADISCWSFYPGKNLGALGDAGALTTNNQIIADYCKTYRNYGSSLKYVNSIKGSNRRMDELQAAILSIKLRNLDIDVSSRRRVAKYYSENIRNYHLKLPCAATVDKDAWHLFVIQCEYRDELQRYLSDLEIGTLIHYPIPPHKQLAYQEHSTWNLPIAERLARNVISIPCNPYISIDEQKYVVEKLNKFSPSSTNSV